MHNTRIDFRKVSGLTLDELKYEVEIYQAEKRQADNWNTGSKIAMSLCALMFVGLAFGTVGPLESALAFFRVAGGRRILDSRQGKKYKTGYSAGKTYSSYRKRAWLSRKLGSWFLLGDTRRNASTRG
jgi:hypothetical protein